jgi:IS1 family transposase/transposase-like protein
MRDWWLIILALGALTPFIIIIWRARRTTASIASQTAAPKAPRVLKPRTPDDCPLCRRPHPTPLLGNVRKPGVKPWPTRKSRRGPAKRVCTAGHACPNAACVYHGNAESTFHALVGNGRRNGIQQLKCQACQTGFSSRWGTALYRLRTPAHAVAQALLAFNLGLSAAEVQLLLGHSDTTLRLWLTRAGLHAQRVHHHFFQNLPLGHLQFDELYTTLRDKAQDLWIWVAFDPKTKLIPALQLGPRTQAMAHAVVHAVGHVLAPGCIPVCTSDGLNLYFYALTAHFGAWCTDPTTGKTSWQVALNLLYGQVKKAYRRRKIVKVERQMQLGQLADLQAALRDQGFTGSINTAFIERLNLTLRHALAALTRRSWATAQLTPELEVHLEWWRLYYHFCRPHQALRTKLETPHARRGRQTPRGYQACTPAMAAKFTDHVWSVEELLSFPIMV